jgi:two-component system capsular synthesis response regulator RcsB
MAITMDKTIKIIVADDHPVAVEGIRVWLTRDPRVEVIATAHDSQSLADLVSRAPCDFVVSDIGMRGINGESNSIAFLKLLLKQMPRPHIIVITMIAHRQMLAGLLQLGVSGIVDKRDGLGSLTDCIAAILNGERFVSTRAAELLREAPSDMLARAGVLSAREWQIFQLYASGIPVKDNAHRLGRSSKTIGTQKRSGMRKLGLDSEWDLIAYLQQIGLT